MPNPASHRLAHALTIAGSDSGGGAGIQADLKTFEALGVFGLSAITAITAQNTRRVSAIEPVSPAVIAAQIAAVREDLRPDAIKLGMVGDGPAMEATARALEDFPAGRMVLDPVMVAKTGDQLMAPEGLAPLRGLLVPMVGVLTPNLPEAAILLGRDPADALRLDEAEQAAWALDLVRELEGWRTATAANRDNEGPWVLLKGGHGDGPRVLDLLAGPAAGGSAIIRRLRHPRLKTRNDHGTGCTLSAAIAGYLAMGRSAPDACEAAAAYLHRALVAAQSLTFGQGRGAVLHRIGPAPEFETPVAGTGKTATLNAPNTNATASAEGLA